MALRAADVHQLVIDLGAVAGDLPAVLDRLRDLGDDAETPEEAAAVCVWALAFTFANCVTPNPTTTQEEPHA